MAQTPIPEEYLDLFEKRTFAHVATLTEDDDPHVTPVWIDYDADANRVLVNTERGRRKERNVARDPSVGISMTDPDDPYRHLSIIGEVTAVTTDGAREHADELAGRYTGTPEYPSEIRTERVLLKIRPTEVF
ncbi:pyridoxamine 5'-phosphate oxidase family protein [Halovivax limisalsi]|uniref:pyridoxamine 5'-phosphate oxidase family protein n=1 Tax=Halovivax limisalsi TaxID=1453760 RepID=UPI001FFCCBD6|nr:PPOX class F420-dependent oxidoreductase [Halovivax limisalsi]